MLVPRSLQRRSRRLLRLGVLLAALVGTSIQASRVEASCGGGSPSIPSVPAVPAAPSGNDNGATTKSETTATAPAKHKYWWVSLVAVGGAVVVFGTVFGVMSSRNDSTSSSTSGLTVHF